MSTLADPKSPHGATADPPSGDAGRAARWAVLLSAPLIGVLLLRAPPINVVSYRDTWFYSGYGWSLRHHIEIFGWQYYGVRFPASLLIGWAAHLLGPVPGYLLIRYVLLTATGIALYACVRRFASETVALAGAVALAASPFYLRLVLWDYSSFMTLPACIAAFATWQLGDGPRGRRLSCVGAGSLVAVALVTNPIAWPLVPSMYGVEAVAAARGGRSALRAFVARVAWSIAGATLVLLAGWLVYVGYLGPIPPTQMLRPVFDFAADLKTHAAVFQIPAHIWLRNEPRVYAPLLMCVAIVLAGGRSLLGTGLAARAGQFALAFTLIVWVYRKAQPVAIIESWWSYSLTATTFAYGIPVILQAVTRRTGRERAVVAAALGGIAIADVLIRSLDPWVEGLYDDLRAHLPLLVGVLALGLLAAVGLATSSPRVAPWAVGAFTAILTAVALTPAIQFGVGRTGEFSPFSTAKEVRGYDAAFRMNQLIAETDRPAERTMIWTDLAGLADIGWANLPNELGGIMSSEAPVAPPVVDPYALSLLRWPTTRRILVFGKRPGAVASALGAVRANGFPKARVERRGAWADGGLRYALIDLKPAA